MVTRPRRLPGVVSASVAAAAVGAALLGGCAPSPTTTYTGDDGEQVTVDWADYPGHAWFEADDALAVPSQRWAEERGEAVLADLERALTERYGMRWSTRTESLWSPRSGNGYGGRSAYVTLNSALRESDDLPTRPAQWAELVETVGTITEEHGLGPVVLDHERVRRTGDPDAVRAMEQDLGTADPDRFWVWNGVADRGAEWLMVDLTDVHRHPDAAAQLDEHRRGGLPARSVRLTYGVTTVEDTERRTFAARVAPFRGLDKPEASESD